ncbi:hypothetical protein ACQ4WX_03720 [Streptomyces lasalocidi]
MPCGGRPVAVHPANLRKEYGAARRHVYADIHCLGCAARTRHVQGGFAQQVAAPDSQIRAPPPLDVRSTVSAEPPSVALHAVVETTELSASAA